MPPKRKPEVKEEEEEEESKDQDQGESEDLDESKPAAEERTKGKAPEKKSKNAWTVTEDDHLLKAVYEDRQDREAEGNGDDDEDWDEIAKLMPNKTPVQCLKRYMELNKKGKAKGAAEIAAASGDDTPDSPEMNPPPAKKPRTESTDPAGGSRWNTDEVELLKKLVEQYKDSKLQEFDI